MDRSPRDPNRVRVSRREREQKAREAAEQERDGDKESGRDQERPDQRVRISTNFPKNLTLDTEK